jgi:hypothetical protein
MEPVELRDPEAARRFLIQGIWLQRVRRPAGSTIRPVWDFSLAIAAAGDPLPPIGFVADFAHVLLDTENSSLPAPVAVSAGFPASLARKYEDYVLGKIFADRTVDRAADVVRRVQGWDRARGAAYIVTRFRERAGFGGALLSPAVIKTMAEAPADDILAQGWDSLNRGVEPLLIDLYEDLIAATRRVADVLGPEDLFELEHGTALAELGQRVGLRQVLQTASRFEAGLPPQKPRPRPGRREIPTPVFDEDAYPVGGFASISTRGTIESLLHSQLAYMEPAAAGRPDLFDVKFVRDELLYYSRDENQFLRRRRSFVVVLAPDLVRARFKDPDLPGQRIVLLLGLLVALVRRLTAWLTADALVFEFLFVSDDDAQPLAPEQALLEMVFRDSIANGGVRLAQAPDLDAARRVVMDHGRRSLCQAVVIGTNSGTLQVASADVAALRISGQRPELSLAVGPHPDGADSWDSWQLALTCLAEAWA